MAAGLLGALNELEHDNTLCFSGNAGALYSFDDYNRDRRDGDECCRARALYFGRDHFYRDGRRYDRRTVDRDGERYYQFVCH
jgi:hypothetical protein